MTQLPMPRERNGLPDDVHAQMVQFAADGRRCALAVVINACGSTPGTLGAQAVLDAEQVLVGTIGGGVVEAQVQRVAAEAIRSGWPAVVGFDLDGGRLAEQAPVCGGVLRVLVDPTAWDRGEVFVAAERIRQRRQRGVLLTRLLHAGRWSVQRDCLTEEEISADIGFPGMPAVRQALQQERPRLFVQEATSHSPQREVLLLPLVPRPRLLIVGGGHVGQALADQAALVGFELAVIDDRPQFTCPSRFPPGTITRCGAIGQQVAAFPWDPHTFAVIVTRGHQQDAVALAACIRQPAAYIGMMGSRRKVAMMRRELVESGQLTPAEFARVYAPIGLDLGSVTVPEIAASIVAQLVAVRRRGIAPRMGQEV